MKINRMNYTQVISKLEKNKAAKSEHSAEKPKDSISISNESIKLNEYMKNMKSGDNSKLERIKAELESGTYKVDSGKLTDKILERMKSQGHEEQ
jgi:negative regulator of flagellin synthesis FlgM